MWTENAQQALQTICRSVQENATFGAPEGAQFHIATDASDDATGGALFQMSEEVPVDVICDDGNFKHVRIIMWLSQRQQRIHPIIISSFYPVVNCMN